MKNYCGKNGCYELNPSDDFEGEVLSVFLNSPIVYIYDNEDKPVRVMGGERPEPDVMFELYEDDDGVMLTDKMEVPSIFLHGVKEFVIALLQNEREGLSDKDSLLRAVTELLDQEGAEWGVVHEPPQE